MNDFLKDFFERATALRNAIQKDNSDGFKDVRLDILSQIVGRVFIYERIPYNFPIKASCVHAATFTTQILKELQIEATITLNKTHTPVYQITEVNAFVGMVSK